MSSDPWYQSPKAKKRLPHLKRVFGNNSNHKTVLTILDFNQSWKKLSFKPWIIRFGSGYQLPKLLLKEHDTCTHRLIIVEDICTEAVRELIRIFNISPEVFENHLSGAQLPGQDPPDYNNHDPEDWFTRRLERDYVSLKWLRSYQLKLKSDAVTLAERSLTCDEGESYSINCNAWRTHINLQGDGGKWSPTEAKSSRLKGSSILVNEERATIWHGQHSNMNFVILLVDAGLSGRWMRDDILSSTWLAPRPGERRKKDGTVKAVTSTTDRAVQMKNPAASTDNGINASGGSQDIGTDELDEKDSKPTSVLDTQIASGVPDNHSGNLEGSHSTQVDQSTGTNRSSEAVTPGKTTPPQSTVQGQNMPCLPAEELFSQPDGPGSHELFEADKDVKTTRNVAHQITDSVAGESSRNSVRSNIPANVRVSKHGKAVSKPSKTVIRNMAIRAPCHNLTLEKAFDKGRLASSTSTLNDLSTWLQSPYVADQEYHDSLGPISVLYEIISQDINDSLRAIHNYFDEIVGLADDELKLEQNILMWRQTLQYLRKELRSLHNTISNLDEHLPPVHRHGRAGRFSTSSQDATLSLQSALSATEDRLQTTYSILASSISVAEARRGISEAESVTRLTELAFVYVPLSFAASFFGMQVKELNPETTSIGGFFGLAVGVTLTSYCIRLMTRSDKLINTKASFLTEVRTEFDLREGSPVKTRQVAIYIFRQMRRAILRSAHLVSLFVVFVLAPLAAMIAVWAHHDLNGNIKVAIALVYVIMSVLIMCFALAILRRF